MTTFTLPPDLEERARAEAERQGVPLDELLRRLVAAQLPAPLAPPTSAVKRNLSEAERRALLRRWRQEDEAAAAAMTPEEVAAAEDDWVELRDALNENRRQTGERPVFP